MKLKVLFFFCSILLFNAAFAQQDSVATVREAVQVTSRWAVNRTAADSATLARQKHLRDSVTWFFMRPDPHRPNLFVEQMLEKHLLRKQEFLQIIHSGTQKKYEAYQAGEQLKRLPIWIFWSMFFIIVAFGVLRIFFKKETDTIIHAFYDNRVLSQLNREEAAFNSWFFLFFYLIFSFLIGLFIYLFIEKYDFLPFEGSGMSIFMVISLLFAIFLGVKIIILRILGFIFQSEKVVKEYITVIYLSFFNISILFIPLTTLLLFTLFKENNWVFYTGIVVITVGFLLQFARILVQILSKYNVSKFYLIIYLCALEICPLIIIVKALGI